MHPDINPELLDEFTPEFLVYGMRLRQQVHDRARRATGPRTEAGKQISSRSAFKHGLASAELIVPGESREEFEALLADLRNQYQPANPTEQLLVQQMPQSFWLSQRALRLQNTCLSDAETVDSARLALYLRYYTTHERAFHKALNALLRLQKERRKMQQDKQPEFVSQKPQTPPANREFVSHDGEFAWQKPAYSPVYTGAVEPITPPKSTTSTQSQGA